MNSKMKKLAFSVMGILLLSFMGSLNAYAVAEDNIAEYDMEQWGMMHFFK